jgi:hypothetical protein
MCEIIYGDLDWQRTDPSGPDCGERWVAFTQSWCCWVEFHKPSERWIWGVRAWGENSVDSLERAKAAVEGQVMI